MLNEVESKQRDTFWYIHEVYNPKGGAAYTGKAVGYYTHRQNVILTGGQSGASQSRRQSGVSGAENSATTTASAMATAGSASPIPAALC